MKKELDFDGYWREEIKNEIDLTSSGIYCVYRGIHDSFDNTVSLKELIYIGESQNVKERIQNHEKIEDWKELLEPEEVIFYSCAPIDSASRIRVEAAMIYEHKPIVNDEYKSNFPFPPTKIVTKNKNGFLFENFIVE
jgi:hypothetical protein